MNDKMWYEDIEAMDIDDRQMEILEKSRVMESERYLRSIPEVRDNVTDSQIVEFSKRHTKEFVQFLQKLQEKEANENNRTYDLVDLLEHCSAKTLVEMKIKNRPSSFCQLDPKMMYNNAYFDTALMAAMYKPNPTSYYSPLTDDLSFLEGLKNTLITKRQLQQIYLSVIKTLEKENKLEETSLTPDMKRMAIDYMESQGKELKRKEKEDVHSKEFISFGLTDIPDAQHFRRAHAGVFGKKAQAKAAGGIFSAEYKPNQRGNISDWETFCINDMPASHSNTLKFGTIFSLSPNARVLTIDSLEDVLDVIEKYPLKKQSIGDDSEIKSCIEKFLNPSYCRQKNGFIDYEAMSRDYDALNVTKNGQEALDYTIRKREGIDYIATYYTGYYSDYARWDIPTLLVLNTEAIQNVKEYVADEEEVNLIDKKTRGYDYDYDYDENSHQDCEDLSQNHYAEHIDQTEIPR